MNDSTVKILGALATLLAASYPFLISFANATYQNMLDHLPQAQHSLLNEITATIVQGVEQSAKTSTLSSTDKKTMAMDAIETILASHHIILPQSLISLAIESAVLMLNEVVVKHPVTTVPVVRGIVAATPTVVYQQPISALPTIIPKG